MINQDSQRTRFIIVISDISLCKKKTLLEPCSQLSLYGYQWWAIKHDKDIDSKGEIIRTHYHIVINGLKRVRVKQLINQMCDIFLTNIENVQVMECVDLFASIQYLIHKNDLNKYQYTIDDILTNDYENLVSYLNETIAINHVSTDRLMEMIFQDHFTLLEVIKAIGIGSYQHYRSTIWDLLNIRDKKDIRCSH